MSVQRVVIGEGERRSPGPGAPVAEVPLDGDGGLVAVVELTIAPGGAMPAHEHGRSAVVLIPLAGAVRV